MALDPQEYTVPELEDALEAVDDADELETILTREEAGENRQTAKKAIESRLAAVAETAEAEEPDEEAEAEDAEAKPEPEPEDAEDDGPSPSYPDPDADERVVYDPAGAGPGATYGHETIHLTDDGQTPRCDAPVGARAQAATRASLPENIDECHACLSA